MSLVSDHSYCPHTLPQSIGTVQAAADEKIPHTMNSTAVTFNHHRNSKSSHQEETLEQTFNVPRKPHKHSKRTRSKLKDQFMQNYTQQFFGDKYTRTLPYPEEPKMIKKLLQKKDPYKHI